MADVSQRTSDPKPAVAFSCIAGVQIMLGDTSSSSSNSIRGSPQLPVRLRAQERNRVHQLISALETQTLARLSQDHSQISHNSSSSSSVTGARSDNGVVQNAVPMFGTDRFQRDYKPLKHLTARPRPRQCSIIAVSCGTAFPAKAVRQGAGGPTDTAANRIPKP